MYILMSLAILLTKPTATLQHIYCPDSKGDNDDFTVDNDYGLNMYTRNRDEFSEDCYLRYGRLHKPNILQIVPDFFEPNDDVLVMIHGWQEWPWAQPRHRTDDVWKLIVNTQCIRDANAAGIENCPPTEHDSKYWHQNGFNLIFMEWYQYAQTDLFTAERRMYEAVYDGKNAVELLYQELASFLELVQWNGDVLRFAGNSLGSQFAMLLGAKWKQESSYGDKLARIALLDHYFNPGARNYLPLYQYDCFLHKTCWAHYSTGEYARWVLLPILRDTINSTVIESYRTAPLLTSFIGDSNDELNEKAIFVSLKPLYYRSSTLYGQIGRHLGAIPMYLHCMKWKDESTDNVWFQLAPSCRMSTSVLRSKYCPGDWRSKCRVQFEQVVDDGVYTTWEMDNVFTTRQIEGSMSFSMYWMEWISTFVATDLFVIICLFSVMCCMRWCCVTNDK